MSESGQDEEEQQAWLIGLASVVFDIDQGQTLEDLYPEGVISEAEGRDVAFNSEPWSATACTTARLLPEAHIAPLTDPAHLHPSTWNLRLLCPVSLWWHCRLPGLHVHGAARQVQHPGLHLLLQASEAASWGRGPSSTQEEWAGCHGSCWHPQESLPESSAGVSVRVGCTAIVRMLCYPALGTMHT